MPKLTTKEIAEIRKILRAIRGNAELLPSNYFVSRHKMMIEIVEQVKGIDKLLPDVNKYSRKEQ